MKKEVKIFPKTSKGIGKMVDFSLSDKHNDLAIVEFSEVEKKEATAIKTKTGLNLKGYKRIMDSFSIGHVMKNHGDKKKEAERGQIEVTKKDFEKIPKIAMAENIVFKAKNNKGLDVILYEKRIGICYYYYEEVRTGKKQLCLNTLFKRK